MVHIYMLQLIPFLFHIFTNKFNFVSQKCCKPCVAHVHYPLNYSTPAPRIQIALGFPQQNALTLCQSILRILSLM